MEKMELEVYSTLTNCGIVRMPNEAYPDIVIRGDTLFEWLATVQGLKDIASAAGLEEAADEAEELAHDIASHLTHWQAVLMAHGFKRQF